MLSGNVVDTNWNTIPFHENEHPSGPVDVACIHHYYTKSEEEFCKKIERGKADMNEKRSQDELINIHDQNNDVVNMDAWNVYLQQRA